MLSWGIYFVVSEFLAVLQLYDLSTHPHSWGLIELILFSMAIVVIGWSSIVLHNIGRAWVDWDSMASRTRRVPPRAV